MDAVLLARIQFAFTVGYHFLFVPFSLGLSILLIRAERRYYKSGREEDKAASDFWIRLFTTTFAIGVATGITMEFAFGTNWAAYSRFVGDIFGAPLAAEGLFSFFLESTFLGVLLFGRNRVSKRFYYAAAWLVAIGAHMSALWIIIANSWQHTPAGFEVVGDRAVLTDFFAASLNPSTLPRFFHTVIATWTVGAFLAAGIAAYHLRKGSHLEFARKTLTFALVFALVTSVAMPFLGHWHADQVGETQPIKMAAFEGIWDTQDNAPLALVGWVDEEAGKTHALAIPGLLSLMLGFSTDTEVVGLNSVPPEDRPPVQLVFQVYHFMVGMGVLMILLAAVALWLHRSGRLERSPRWLWALTWSFVLPMLAIQTGWAAAEVGRQPWVVQGLLRTKDAVSAVVPAEQIALTLVLFALIYALLFVGFVRIFVGIVKKGPRLPESPETASAAAREHETPAADAVAAG